MTRLLLVMVIALAGCATQGGAQQSAKPAAYDGPPMVMRTQSGDMVRLSKEPCPNVSGWLAMSSADMLYEGRSYKACWTMLGPYVLVFDSNGDLSPIPASAFKVDEGT